MSKIKLTKGYEVTVSAGDLNWLMQWKWSASDCSRPWHTIKKVYAVRATRVGGIYKKIYMHRQIMERILEEDGLDPGIEMFEHVVDHGDGDGLNNTRGNLWLAPGAVNASLARTDNPGRTESGRSPEAKRKRAAHKGAITKRKKARAQRSETKTRRTDEVIAKSVASGKDKLC